MDNYVSASDFFHDKLDTQFCVSFSFNSFTFYFVIKLRFSVNCAHSPEEELTSNFKKAIEVKDGGGTKRQKDEDVI